MKSDGTVLIFGAVIITAILYALAGCETTPDPRDEIRPPFEPCEIRVIDRTGEHCRSRESVCRDLVNCGG